MRKWIVGGLAALLVAFGAWFWASPAIAMGALRDALAEGDKDELAERVDFPAVRESLKAQVSAMMLTEMQKQKDANNPFAAMGSMFVTAIAGQMIDGIVTPQGLKAMVQHGEFKPAAATSQKEPQQEWKVERDGLDKFRAVPALKPGEKGPKLLFKRDGLGWQLVDIEMPEGGLGK